MIPMKSRLLAIALLAKGLDRLTYIPSSIDKKMCNRTNHVRENLVTNYQNPAYNKKYINKRRNTRRN